MIQQVYLTNSCPLINAKAVFGARNLLSVIRGEKFYNDKVICNSQGYAYKTKQEKETKPNLDSELRINTYPNPANEKLIITLSNAINGDITIKLNDLFGRTILREKKTELFNIELDIKNIPQGLYILAIQNNNVSIFNTKVYVQR